MRKIGKGYKLILISILMGGAFLSSTLAYPVYGFNLRPALKFQGQNSLGENLQKLRDTAGKIDDEISKIFICAETLSEGISAPNYFHDKCIKNEMLILEKGKKRIYLTRQLAHLLGHLLNEVSLLINHTVTKDIAMRYTISICRKLDVLARLKEKDLMLRLLQGNEVFNILGYPPNKGRIPKIENRDAVISKARELITVFKNEVIKDELFELVRLCDRDPNLVLKKWYGNENEVASNSNISYKVNFGSDEIHRTGL
ncbi:MAG: hypothetical protein P9L93_07325 [Candidatus Gorgyraea atricola]|nr:hypothetical protein [Candidatus Gorgyraea atricola]